MRFDKDNEVSFAKKLFRFIKYNKLLFLFIIVIVAHLFLAVLGSKGLLTKFKLQTDMKKFENQLLNEQKKNDSLKRIIEELNNSDTNTFFKFEKIAREKYGMTKEGEKIYKIVIDSTE